MLDALGIPQSVLVLGAGSEIATALVTRLAATGRLQRAVLAARRPEALAEQATALAAEGVDVQAVAFDATAPHEHVAFMDQAFAGGDVDLVVVAFAVLGETAAYAADPPAAAAAAATNLGGAMSATLAAVAHLQAQGHGKVVLLSSVAAERVRGDAYVYGATKAGLDGFGQGLGDALHGSGVSVLVVRPGFVRSKMTEGLDPPPIGATDPTAVAEDVVRALASDADVVWSPGYLRYVFSGLRHLPRPLWRRAAAAR